MDVGVKLGREREQLKARFNEEALLCDETTNS